MEDGKDTNLLTRAGQTRALPQRLLRQLVLFLALCFTFSAVSIPTVRHFRVYSAVTSIVNVEELRTLEQWINPHIILMHNMSDKELFLRASSLPRLKKHSFIWVPKVAFMFLTKGPLPLAPLWERFFKGNEGMYSIYIHSFPSYEANFPSSSVFYKRQIPSQERTQMLERMPPFQFHCNGAEWSRNGGKMSICDAERRLLANALLDISNEWFILLSESCIPLYNFTLIYNYMIHSKYSFIGSSDEPGQYGRGHYNTNMLPEISITNWRKGSQWFQINRRLALYIIKDTTLYPKFAEFCKPDCYVDEHYFPTMLTIQAAHLLANRSVTWVDWSRGGPHPATFDGEDITEEFMKRVYEGHDCLYHDQVSSVCYLFARKFSPSALEALFLIAPKFLGF